MYMYFPDEYRWSKGVLMALGAAKYDGAEIGEIDKIGQRLSRIAGDDQAWYVEWKNMGRHVESLGVAAQEEGHDLTASSCYFRATNYYQTAERFRQPKDHDAFQTYRRSVECFHKALELRDWPSVEIVEVPFENKSLPAYLVKPGRGGKYPVVVFFDGSDVTKEICYFSGVPDLVRRGIGCLVVDGPGNGESIRFRGMALRYDYEKPASATIDYLETRPDVDKDRIGIMGISLGGYYASRAAAFEKRFKTCVAWGAIYDYYKICRRRIQGSSNASNEGQGGQMKWVRGEHVKWTLGVDTYDEALAALEKFKLEGIAGKIKCKYLLVHGGEDRQTPVEEAERLFDEVGSSEKTLKIFTAEEGGSEHCQRDNLTVGTSYMFDWISDNL